MPLRSDKCYSILNDQPFCPHVALLQKFKEFGRVFCKQSNVSLFRFQNEYNKV